MMVNKFGNITNLLLLVCVLNLHTQFFTLTDMWSLMFLILKSSCDYFDKISLVNMEFAKILLLGLVLRIDIL